MRYMLDTSICIHIIRKREMQVVRRLQALKISDVCISSVTFAELEYGVAKSARPDQNRWALAEFLAPIEILPFGEPAAQVYGNLRARLEDAGSAIGAMDMLIAAHALSEDLSLATSNAGEFRRVQGLSVENWI